MLQVILQNPKYNINSLPAGLKGGCETFATLVSLNASYKGFMSSHKAAEGGLQLQLFSLSNTLPIIFLITQVNVLKRPQILKNESKCHGALKMMP